MYGQKPKLLGRYPIEFDESCFYLYMPIKLHNSSAHPVLGRRLTPLSPLVNRVVAEIDSKKMYYSNAIYITVKHGIITPGNPGNRPGYHSDGFGTKDLNYIWYDCNPTIFNSTKFILSNDDVLSMQEMEEQALPQNEFSYPPFSLLRLNQFNIHKVAEVNKPMYRTFCKISVSKDRYNLVGNTHNYGLKYDWPMYQRNEKRNVPQK